MATITSMLRNPYWLPCAGWSRILHRPRNPQDWKEILSTQTHVCSRLLHTLLLVFFHGCSGLGSGHPAPLQFKAAGNSPEVIALYEAWFGHPEHISVGYSSQDPAVIKSQIRHAKALGISAFVVDWYGDRQPFIDQSYALIQKLAEKGKFHVAMMYDETDDEVGATDEAIADFTMFHDAYLSPQSPGHCAYLTYEGRPVIFIFPKGGAHRLE